VNEYLTTNLPRLIVFSYPSERWRVCISLIGSTPLLSRQLLASNKDPTQTTCAQPDSESSA
jgi:hypothetical protein